MSNNKQRRRVVSKTEYVGRLGVNLGANLIGCFMCLLGCGGFLAMVTGLLLWLGMLSRGWLGQNAVMILVCIFLGGVASFTMLRGGWMMIEETANREPVVPLTRHTADDLPPEETLVRASIEPPREDGYLLRAAQSGPETPAEQLLRPAEAQAKDAHGI